MTARSALASLALLVESLLVAAPAFAEPSAPEKAQADAFFHEGRTLMAEGQTARACGKFAESQRLDPAPGTLVNLALCHEKEGKTASAWAEFNEVAERPGDDKARGPFARGHAQEIEKRLSRVRVTVERAAPDEAVTIDGRPHGAQAWGSAVPLDPGEHVVLASAPGKQTWQKSVRLEQGPVVVDVAVPALDEERAAPAVVAVSSPRAELPPSPPPESSTRRTLGFVVGGAGLVALGVGGYFGLRTLSKKSDADALCPNNKCAGDPRVADLDDAAKSSATVSTIALAVGVVAVAAGVYLVVSSPSASRGSARLSVVPSLSREGGGASLAGRF